MATLAQRQQQALQQQNAAIAAGDVNAIAKKAYELNTLAGQIKAQQAVLAGSSNAGSVTQAGARQKLQALQAQLNAAGGQAAVDAQVKQYLAIPGVQQAYNQYQQYLASQSGGGLLGNLVKEIGPAVALPLAAAGAQYLLGGAPGAGATTQAAAPVSGSWFPGTAGPGVSLGTAPAAAVTTSALPAAMGAAPAVTAADLATMGITPGVSTTVPGLTTAAIDTAGMGAATTAAGAATGGGLLSNIAGGINNTLGTNLTGSQIASGIGAGLNALGSSMGVGAAQGAQAAANAQNLQAAQQAAAGMKFKPVGVTTRFSTPKYTYDAQGNLVSAGYQLTPQLQAQQTGLLGLADQSLAQAQAAQAATAPMGTAAQSLFSLGQGYLATTPQQAAADWMAAQQAVLAAPRADQLSAIQNKLAQQGRIGLATGGNAGMMATNPEMAAYQNALAMQDLQLAAQAQQQGQQQVQFGAGLMGTGANLLSGMYGTQQAALSPYTSAMGGVTNLEQMAQQPLALGQSLGQNVSQSAADSARLLYGQQVAGTQAMLPYNAYSPTAGLISGLGSTISGLWGA